MPNIPTVSSLKLIKVLRKKGFSLNRIHGSHHIFVRYLDKRLVSIPVHKGKDLGRGITLSILRDAQITIEEFQKLL